MASKEIEYCKLCGAIATDTHHLIGGRNRTLCDIDNLTIKICRECHSQIHQSGKLEIKSKSVGQALYELSQMVQFGTPEEVARERFMTRYGKNYL